MPENLTKAEREEGKRLCEAATPGPWTLEIEEYEQNSGQICISEINRLMHDTEWADPEDWERDIANSHFIAHARTAYPAALKEIDRLQAENAALREALLEITPPHRKRGTCWCGIGRDIDAYGHASSCDRARDLLQTAMETLTRRTVDRAHALLEGKDAEPLEKAVDIMEALRASLASAAKRGNDAK